MKVSCVCFFLSRSVRGLFPNFECEVETGLTSLRAEGASPGLEGQRLTWHGSSSIALLGVDCITESWTFT